MSDPALAALADIRVRHHAPTVRGFAGRMIYPGGPLAGRPINLLGDPVHNWVVEQVDSGKFDSLSWCACPQISGKTLIAIMLLALHNAIGRRQPTGYALPTLQDLDKAWEGKIKKQIIGSGFGSSLPTRGPGARGGRGPQIQLTDPDSGEVAGSLIFMAGGAYGDTASRVLVDEVDQFRKADLTPDWASLMDLEARTKAYGRNRFIGFVGTMEVDDPEKSIIYELAANQGTGARPHLRCPHCGLHQIVTGEQLRYETDDEQTVMESARIYCSACGSAWGSDELRDAQRHMLIPHSCQRIEKGKIVGPDPRSKRLGLIQNCYGSTIVSLPDVARERYLAEGLLARTGDHRAIKKYTLYNECAFYRKDINTDEDGQTLIPTRNRLAALSEASKLAVEVDVKQQDADSWHLTGMPAWGEFLTLGIDVQAGGDRAPPRLYLVVYCRGGARGAIVGWGSFICCPMGRQATEPELHAALDRVNQLMTDWSPSVPIVRRGVDVGDQTDEIKNWLKSQRDWWAIKGTGPLKPDYGDRAGWIYHRNQADYRLHLVEGKSVLRVIHGEILARDGEGSCLLPHGLNNISALIRHICASVEYFPGKWSERPSDRKHHPEWQKRNDYADSLVYARALAYEYQTQKPAPTNKRKYGLISTI